MSYGSGRPGGPRRPPGRPTDSPRELPGAEAPGAGSTNLKTNIFCSALLSGRDYVLRLFMCRERQVRHRVGFTGGSVLDRVWFYIVLCLVSDLFFGAKPVQIGSKGPLRLQESI